MHWRKQSWLVSVMQGHSTRSDQAVANNLQTSTMAHVAPTPTAATNMLSLNCAKDTMRPFGFFHMGKPLAVNDNSPSS